MLKSRLYLILFFLMFVFSFSSSAQGFYSKYQAQKESYVASKNFTALRSNLLLDSIISDDGESFGEIKPTIEKKFLKISISPLFGLGFGFQNEEEKLVETYSLGTSVKAKFKKKWNFHFAYQRINSTYMAYQRAFVRDNNVVPGMNVAKQGNLIGADYVSSYLNFRPNKTFDFEIGYGRQFIGDGYRSLLQSKFSNASPYLKVNSKFWKFKYTNLFQSHQNIWGKETSNSDFLKKYTASHFLDWKVTDWLNIGIFETIVWQAKDTTYNRGFEPTYLNPVIFYRPVEFSLGSSDNAMVGANLKLTLAKKHIVYSQLILDEFLIAELRADFSQWRNSDKDIQSGWWANKYGIQFGWTTFDFLGINGLKPRVEFNMVRPFTYAHQSPTQSYSNYNLSLAHPLGANFRELVVANDYFTKKWNLKTKFIYSLWGESPDGFNYGENLQLSYESRTNEYENEIGQGIEHVVLLANAELSYLIHKKWDATISLGYTWREEFIERESFKNNMIYFRLKTNLFNPNWDF